MMQFKSLTLLIVAFGIVLLIQVQASEIVSCNNMVGNQCSSTNTKPGCVICKPNAQGSCDCYKNVRQIMPDGTERCNYPMCCVGVCGCECPIPGK